MYISLQELELRSVRFAVDIPAGEIEFVDPAVQTSVLHAAGIAELVSHALGEIRIRGNLTVAMEAPCDRCLEPARFAVSKAFDLVYIPTPEDIGGERAIDESGSDVGFYEGAGIELNDVLREVVLLALPMRWMCEDDCKGICPTCGRNRNQEECDCNNKAVDDRWNKLRGIRVETGPGK
ncbi:MAG TPA: DUF177 domain-containing protein [Bryobacteraceae bacterium]|jgi:uncharacterized protein|nr:DUF177 domain-containing protein [Bryobacteraceae bacterium]